MDFISGHVSQLGSAITTPSGVGANVKVCVCVYVGRIFNWICFKYDLLAGLRAIYCWGKLFYCSTLNYTKLFYQLLKQNKSQIASTNFPSQPHGIPNDHRRTKKLSPKTFAQVMYRKSCSFCVYLRTWPCQSSALGAKVWPTKFILAQTHTHTNTHTSNHTMCIDDVDGKQLWEVGGRCLPLSEELRDKVKLFDFGIAHDELWHTGWIGEWWWKIDFWEIFYSYNG